MSREHITDGKPCWCGPKVERHEEGDIWIHREIPPCPECETLRQESSELRRELDAAREGWKQSAIAHAFDGREPDWKEVERCALMGHPYIDPPCSGDSARLLLGRALKAEEGLSAAQATIEGMRKALEEIVRKQMEVHGGKTTQAAFAEVVCIASAALSQGSGGQGER